MSHIKTTWRGPARDMLLAAGLGTALSGLYIRFVDGGNAWWSLAAGALVALLVWVNPHLDRRIQGKWARKLAYLAWMGSLWAGLGAILRVADVRPFEMDDWLATTGFYLVFITLWAMFDDRDPLRGKRSTEEHLQA